MTSIPSRLLAFSLLALTGLPLPGHSAPAPPAAAAPPSGRAVCVPEGAWVVPTASGPRPVAAATLLEAAAQGGVVLLGERHDRVEHHAWQLRTIEALLARRPDLAVGLEMVPRQLQPVLDRWVAGELDEGAFLEAVEWRRVWGFDPELYLPILRMARQRRVPLLALNVDPRLVRRVRAAGFEALPPQLRQELGRPLPPSPAYRAQLHTVWLAHRPGAQQPGSARPGPDDPGFLRFLDSQLLWDRAMATAIAQARARRPRTLVVALVGVGHLAGGEGVPRQLRGLGVRGVRVWLPWEPDQDCRQLTPGLADAVVGLPASAPPAAANPVASGPAGPPPPGTRLGVYLETLGGEVRITRVAPGTLAAAADLRVGDRLVTIGDEPVRTARQVIERVRHQPPGLPLRLQVRREGRMLTKVLRLPMQPAPGSPPAPVRT